MTLYLLSFNNYYNRIVKKFDTLDEYEPFVLDVIPDVNFNPNDGVATEQIINFENSESMPDYALVVDNGIIVSRWFVIEGQRTRALQFKLKLYRDVIADWKEEITQCPMFVEKATLEANNPLIFNSENMSYNQILQSQTLLKDSTDTAWIVGYMPKNYPEAGQGQITAQANYSGGADYQTSSLSDWVNFAFGLTLDSQTNTTNGKYGYPDSSTTLKYKWSFGGTRQFLVTTSVDSYGNLISNTAEDAQGSAALVGRAVDGAAAGQSENEFKYKMMAGVSQSFLQKFQFPETSLVIREAISSSLRTLDSQQEDRIRSLDGSTIYDSSTDTVYKINVEVTRPTTTLSLVSGTPMFNAMTDSIFYGGGLASSRFWIEGYPPNDDSFQIVVTEPYYRISFEQALVEVNCTLSQSGTRFACTDSPYDIFCIPYGNIKVLQNGQTSISKTSSEAAMAIAMEITKDTGLSQGQFDIQLLPYCPALYCLTGVTGEIDIGDAAVDWITSANSEKVSVVLWSTVSNFRFNIPYSIPRAATAVEVKVQSECDKWRLCSPNYNGLFEFNAAKNNGVTGFQVDCTLKPYSPFIHIKPNFGGLYGINPEKDSRGLILGGDFSLPQVNSAWATYQLNNKNYQEIFDRQIQNMEVKNNVQRSQEVMSAITGTMTGGITGAVAGAQAGPYGMIAGAIGGTAASAVGGIIDYQMNELLRNEAIDYSKDQFGYQLGNIQAIPNSISKTSAITYTNKLFPFIEYYTATEVEKNALRNKVQYNGMTVMTIGTIQDFTGYTTEPTYVKGKLIRMENSKEDCHVVNVIASELNKGVYIK